MVCESAIYIYYTIRPIFPICLILLKEGKRVSEVLAEQTERVLFWWQVISQKKFIFYWAVASLFIIFLGCQYIKDKGLVLYILRHFLELLEYIIVIIKWHQKRFSDYGTRDRSKLKKLLLKPLWQNTAKATPGAVPSGERAELGWNRLH